MLKNNTSRRSSLFIFISGLSFVIFGFFFIFIPFDDFNLNINLLGISFLIIGMFHILSYYFNKKWLFRPGWTLSQGFFIIVLGLLLIYILKNELSDLINIIIAFLALSTGTSQVSAAVQLRSLEFTRWYRMLLLGFVNILFFAFFIVEPIDKYISLLTEIGIYLTYSGVVCLLEPFNYKNQK